MINYMYSKGLYHLQDVKIIDSSLPKKSYCFNATDLGLTDQLAEEWSHFVEELISNWLCLNNVNDSLIWTWDASSGKVKVKKSYEVIAHSVMAKDIRWWSKFISKWHMPIKIKCFPWLVIHNKILTWENL